MASPQCKKIITGDYQCTKMCTLGSEFCWQHKPLVKNKSFVESQSDNVNLNKEIVLKT